MSRHTCCTDKHAEAVFACILSELRSLCRGTVSRHYVELKGHSELGAGLRRLSYNGKVAVASHNDSYFFHGVAPFKKIIAVRARTAIYLQLSRLSESYRECEHDINNNIAFYLACTIISRQEL